VAFRLPPLVSAITTSYNSSLPLSRRVKTRRSNKQRKRGIAHLFIRDHASQKGLFRPPLNYRTYCYSTRTISYTSSDSLTHLRPSSPNSPNRPPPPNLSPSLSDPSWVKPSPSPSSKRYVPLNDSHRALDRLPARLPRISSLDLQPTLALRLLVPSH
jgi:hypothetical protein